MCKDNVVPIQPYGIRGVLWYQGETEADPLSYDRMLPGLIGNWRADWGQGSLPLYCVQLAPISGRPNYAIIRDAQVASFDTAENTGMACIIDIPTVPTTDIHSKDKEPVGERLALIARAQLYGEPDLIYSGPIRDPDPHASFVSGSSILVGFKHVDGGFQTIGGVNPALLMIAGPDGVY